MNSHKTNGNSNVNKNVKKTGSCFKRTKHWYMGRPAPRPLDAGREGRLSSWQEVRAWEVGWFCTINLKVSCELQAISWICRKVFHLELHSTKIKYGWITSLIKPLWQSLFAMSFRIHTQWRITQNSAFPWITLSIRITGYKRNSQPEELTFRQRKRLQGHPI